LAVGTNEKQRGTLSGKLIRLLMSAMLSVMYISLARSFEDYLIQPLSELRKDLMGMVTAAPSPPAVETLHKWMDCRFLSLHLEKDKLFFLE